MIKVLIADDHPVVREGLKQIISKANDMNVAAEALDCSEVIEFVKREDWDVVVMDLNMPGKDGLELLKDLKNIKPELPILILSVFPEEQIGVRTFKLGASGYMNKETAPKELVNAIRKIYNGGKYISEALAEKLVAGLEDGSDKNIHDLLSDREFQVLRLIASGKDVDEIADELFISVKTVRTYRDRILEKLKLKNNVEIAHYALKNKLLE
ncbi:MAG: DNA-binding response regulator [Ignavibacteria bacterium GWB2_35_6b]|nr:MAG: DNA-binding response regulator [Ignavibacteria bacterium GWB2_35_6b]